MISRRAQLKGQDQKVSSLTDDFTMRNFIAVGSPQLPSFQRQQEPHLFHYKNPSFIEEKVYEPVMLNIPLLGQSAEGAPHDPEPVSDAIVAVENVEARGTATEGTPPIKKIRTIRFAEPTH